MVYAKQLLLPAAIAAAPVELLMMDGETSETCRAFYKNK
jgi:hypothetical protein